MAHHSPVRIAAHIGNQVEGVVIDPVMRDYIWGEATDEEVAAVVKEFLKDRVRTIRVQSKSGGIAAEVEAEIEAHVSDIS